MCLAEDRLTLIFLRSFLSCHSSSLKSLKGMRACGAGGVPSNSQSRQKTTDQEFDSSPGIGYALSRTGKKNSPCRANAPFPGLGNVEQILSAIEYQLTVTTCALGPDDCEPSEASDGVHRRADHCTSNKQSSVTPSSRDEVFVDLCFAVFQENVISAAAAVDSGLNRRGSLA